MKSIYEKITVVLIIGFLVQVALIMVFYNQVAVKRIISVINEQENIRQTIMRDACMNMQRLNNRGGRIDKFLSDYSEKNNVTFVLKNIDGNVVFNTEGKKDDTCIKAEAFIRGAGRTFYILEGYFPANISLDPSFKEGRIRIVYIGVIFIVAAITLLIIYKVVAGPLKKLSIAAKDLNYGNTIVKVPYYGEDELGMLCRNFEDMGIRLKESEEAQQELLQAISHDIKTPLTSIIGYSKRLLDGKAGDDKKNDYYETIFRKANDLKFLLEELDDYTNLNLESKYDKKLVDCGSYFKDIADELGSEVKHKGSSFEYIFSIYKNININIDPRKIKRVFINIIENSLKYAGEKCNINIIVTQKNREVLFEIWDNGPGVPEPQLNRIFDRFFRVDSSRCREKGGTGLGLSICKDIIKGHHGDIGAYYKDGGGFCIWFTLPIS